MCVCVCVLCCVGAVCRPLAPCVCSSGRARQRLCAEAGRRLNSIHMCGTAYTQVIDLGDDMEFDLLPEGAAKDVLECSDPTIPSDDSNLVIKVGSTPGCIPGSEDSWEHAGSQPMSS